MSTEEDAIIKEYEDAGLMTPEDTPTPTPAEKETPEEPEKPDEAPEASEEPEQPKVERKRSIYDEYKDKKSEAKSATERAEAAERERDEWKTKFEALNSAQTPQERKEAKDDIDQLAEEIGASPEIMRRMQTAFLKGVKSPETISESDRALLKEVELVKAEKAFDAEFTQLATVLKEYFPNASAEETAAVRKELQRLAHTQDWHDKELDYVLFKNKSTISALVSPKKRGIESKNPKDAAPASTDFDPNADIDSMSAEQARVWEEQYRNATRGQSGLSTDSQGRKVFI